MVIYPFRRHPFKFIRLQYWFSIVLWGTQCWTWYAALESSREEPSFSFPSVGLTQTQIRNSTRFISIMVFPKRSFLGQRTDAERPQASPLSAPKHFAIQEDLDDKIFRICWEQTSLAMETLYMIFHSTAL